VKTLRLYADGAARGNPGPSGLGVVITDSEGAPLWGGCRYIGIATNNRAEYLALIEGLKAVAKWNPDRLQIFMDSQLVVEQLNGRYRVRNASLQALHKEATTLLTGFPARELSHVRRDGNKGADALANRAIDEFNAGAASSAQALSEGL